MVKITSNSLGTVGFVDGPLIAANRFAADIARPSGCMVSSEVVGYNARFRHIRF